MDRAELRSELEAWLDSLDKKLERVLLLPPDYTRFNSGAGVIVQELYDILSGSAEIDIMPALGCHEPMTDAEIDTMFGTSIPKDRYIHRNWRTDVVRLGEVPAGFVREVSDGRLDYSIEVEIDPRIIDSKYDQVISIGQVVPHEVVGMANYTKNVLVGCGGKGMIDKTHFLGAVSGMEQLMGRDHSSVRKVFDYAEEHFLKDLPLEYILTVTTTKDDVINIEGLFLGRSRENFEQAVALSQEKNLDLLDKPLEKVVAYLDADHFKSTWVGNKAIYRLRMAMADDGELLIIAPGVRHFGEDPDIDQLIRKYGYRGTPYTLEMVEKNKDLQDNLSAAAHLIHGSSEGRFRIIYAPGHLTREEVEGVGFEYRDIDEALKLYEPAKLQDGFNTVNGEQVFFVSNPALGLWALKENF
ncbi:MAG: lactate racemase domain-containing protein [Limnochordia bacterium]|jgi:nickel-dependent lactate racemase